MNPAVLGALRGLGFAVLVAVLGWLANATNLQGVLTPDVATLVAVIALAVEHQIAAKTGNALFGAVKA